MTWTFDPARFLELLADWLMRFGVLGTAVTFVFGRPTLAPAILAVVGGAGTLIVESAKRSREASA